MLQLRKGEDRGHVQHGWLESWHSFSFADYQDPAHMGFSVLRVINDDIIEPGQGFGTHGHRDMEIITYVTAGELEHKDSMGNGSIIRPGDVQRMSAGHGVQHSEFNPSLSAQARLLQLWILPAVRGVAPGYEQKRFGDADKRGRLCLIASADGDDGSLRINQDARLLAGLFDGAEQATHVLAPARWAYLHVVRGSLLVNGQALAGGDALKLSGEAAVQLEQGRDAEVLVFDLPPGR